MSGEHEETQSELKPALTIVVLRGPGVDEPRERRFTQPEILIGRPDPAKPSHVPDLDLEPDFQSSRRHVRLLWKDRRWFIEDLGSRHGTLVDGEEIKGPGLVPLPACATVSTGETTWTPIPQGEILFRQGGVFVCGTYSSTLSYAAHHSRMPLFGPLTVLHAGRSPSPPIKLTLHVKDISDASELEIPPLDPGSRIALEVPQMRLHTERLRIMTEPIRGELRINAAPRGEDAVFSGVSVAKEITILGFWDWSYEPAARRTIAAFVSPRHPFVERAVVEARGSLQRIAGRDSFGEVLRSDRGDPESLILEALYDSLAANHDVHWLPPESAGFSGRGMTHQTVRPPHRMFPGGFGREAQGTCLDLAVFIAGCLEKVQLCPVLVFVGDVSGCGGTIPRHVLAGCWVGTVPGGRPVLSEAESIRREVSRGNLLLVESTGLTADTGTRLSFAEARDAALSQVGDAERLCLVDIMALRPPFGVITPMEAPLDPEVGWAFDAARALSRSKQRELIETTHLFFGVLTVGGPVIRALFERLPVDRGMVCSRLSDQIQARSFQGEPVPTRNYHECRRLAETLAREAGVLTVREQDLLWALLLKGPDSSKFQAACRDAGLDISDLASLLEEHYPCPDTRRSTNTKVIDPID